MTRKQKNKIRAEKNRISNLIPYEAVYEDGMVKVGDREYIKAYFIEESTYEDIKNVSADEISSKFYKLLESLSGRFSIQFLVYNSLVDKSEFLKKIVLKEKRDGRIEEYRQYYNDLICENSSIGHNNVKKNRYFALKAEADIAEEAQDMFFDAQGLVADSFYDICRTRIRELTAMELLKILYGIYNPKPDGLIKRQTIEDERFSSLSAIKRRGFTTKELIAPDYFDDTAIDHMVLGKNTYARSFYISSIPGKVSANLISDMTNISSNMLFSCIFEPIDAVVARTCIDEKVEDNTKVTHSLVKNTIKDRKLRTKVSTRELISTKEEDYFNLSAQNVLNDDTGAMLCTFAITLYAEDMDTLERDTKLLHISSSKFAHQVKVLDLMQKEGLMTTLPLCKNMIDCKRLLTTKKISQMPPLCLSEVMLKDGVFCGLNAINDNLVLLNRKNNQTLAGLICGTEHSGKTFQCKREALNALLSTDDEVIIIANGRGYGKFTKTLGGKVYTNIFTNPFVLADQSGQTGLSKFSKCLFLEALARLSLNEMGIEDDTGIDLEVSRLYEELKSLSGLNSAAIYMYFSKKSDEYPLMSKVSAYLYDYEQSHMYLFNERCALNLIKVESALELVFAMEHVYMLTKKDPKKTFWVFCDSIDELFMDDHTFHFLKDVIEKMNQDGTIFTSVIQSSVKLVTDSAAGYRLSDLINCFGYYKLLNQGVIERQKYTELLNIPNALVNYVTQAELGKGIILTPSAGLAFDDNFLTGDDDTSFYEIFKG